MKRISVLAVVSLLSVQGIADPAPVTDLTADSAVVATPIDTTAAPTPAIPNNTTATSLPVAPAVPDNMATLSLPLDQRVLRLEGQVDNIVKMNLPQQLDELQQQLQTLTGQMQVLQHDLSLLNQQQRAFYQDLDQRIKQAQNLNGSDTTPTVPPVVATASAPVSAPASAAKTAAPASKKSEAEIYQAAFDALKQKQFAQAKKGFAAYLSTFPNGQFAANSHYWMGELYVLDKDYKSAESEFALVTTDYKNSDKAKDAQLKLAIVHVNLGQTDLAKKELMALKQKYPNSTVAQLASLQLQQLQ